MLIKISSSRSQIYMISFSSTWWFGWNQMTDLMRVKILTLWIFGKSLWTNEIKYTLFYINKFLNVGISSHFFLSAAVDTSTIFQMLGFHATFTCWLWYINFLNYFSCHFIIDPLRGSNKAECQSVRYMFVHCLPHHIQIENSWGYVRTSPCLYTSRK